ncbi:MAG: hypothetical protein KDC38_03515 [Planctomycetes bacterium]|nr:hypothetical protein [Planctomycetota bacterium]
MRTEETSRPFPYRGPSYWGGRLRTGLTRSGWTLALLVGVVSHGGIAWAQSCYVSTLYTSSRDDAIVREIDADTLVTIQEFVIDLGPANPVAGVPGIAKDPTSDNFYLLVQGSVPPGAPPFLATWDPLNQVVDVIGSTVVNFDCLDVNAGGFPHAVALGSASPPRSFCELSLISGAPIDLCTADNVAEGQGLAYHPGTGAFFSASSTMGSTFAELDVTSPGSLCGQTASPLPVALSGSNVSAICWSESASAFLWKVGGAGGNLYSLDLAGNESLLGTLDHNATDMTLVAVPTPCVGVNFQRADANGDGGVDIADAVFILAGLFIPGSPGGDCIDANDVNDDGTADISDAVFLLSSLFIPGSAAPPPPTAGVECSVDPTADALDCASYTCP